MSDKHIKKLHNLSKSAEVDARQRKNTFALFAIILICAVLLYNSHSPLGLMFKGIVDIFAKIWDSILKLAGLNLQTVLIIGLIGFAAFHYSGVKRSEGRREFFDPFKDDEGGH